jgi:hypothetical protein
MATPPDFTVGQVLTAAQMNQVGMWLVKSQTIGSAVSSVTVTDAFSADFDAYKIIVTGGSGSANSGVALQFAPSTVTGYNANYFSATLFGSYGGIAPQTAGNNNGSTFSNVGFLRGASGFIFACEITNPYLAKNAYIGSFYAGADAGVTSGYQGNTGQYTGFTLSTSTATMTGGEIRVYGYNQ